VRPQRKLAHTKDDLLLEYAGIHTGGGTSWHTSASQASEYALRVEKKGNIRKLNMLRNGSRVKAIEDADNAKGHTLEGGLNRKVMSRQAKTFRGDG